PRLQRPGLTQDVSFLVAEAGHATRDFSDRFVEQPVAACVAQIGHRERELSRTRGFLDQIQPSRMRFRIRSQKFAAVGGCEVANFEDRFEMLDRDRHRVHRIADLRDERTVLSERGRQTMARSGRARIENASQYCFVRTDSVRALPRSLHVGHGSVSTMAFRSTAATASFAPPTSEGGIDSERKPAASNSGMARGSPPASPHKLTSMCFARAASTTNRKSRNIAS